MGMQYFFTGKLVVRPTHAKLTRDTEFFGKMDPYVKVQLGERIFRTRIHQEAGKTPSWTDAFQFARKNEVVLHVQVCDEDLITDDLVGTGKLSIAEYCTPEEERKKVTVPIYYKGKPAGELFMEIEFEPDKLGPGGKPKPVALPIYQSATIK
eukprot:TRINITY_DN12_c0_g1_i13.p2 TRINITY_DN12_c0_g1~~TRINITY_DN12_c0_g1_i13.p2  ORF type:complete len:152 (+),score=20.81 TRINITY_DN12_c0_g1_i13:2-457(+)